MIKVNNPSDQPVKMNLSIFSWADSHDLSALEKTDDMIAVPPVFEIPPNGEQTVRIALRKALEIEQEKAYRILIGEVPSEVAPRQAVGINLTVNLPIFVRPEGAEALPVWTIEKGDDDKPKLVLANQGRSFLKIDKISLVGENQVATPIFERQGGYVLAGDNRTWPLNLDLAALKRSVTITTDSNIGPIEAVVLLPES